jgi:CubicO group peptidase (beta-lactamase class C family)
LFGPLGFKNHRWPHQTVRGNESTFAQLYLRPRDMLKYGILYLQGGQWEGKQLVSRKWIERSTQPLTAIGSKSYGYFWWHQTFAVKAANGRRNIDTILATGNGGQKIFIVPSLELVAVFTGGNYNSRTDTPPNEIMGDVILPQLSTE